MIPDNADDAFKAWWYDYCVKNGHHNPVKLREVAEAAWRARAPRSEMVDNVLPVEVCHAPATSGTWNPLGRHCTTCGAFAEHGDNMECKYVGR